MQETRLYLDHTQDLSSAAVSSSVGHLAAHPQASAHAGQPSTSRHLPAPARVNGRPPSINRASYTAFTPARPPRTSSLLPPPRIAVAAPHTQTLGAFVEDSSNYSPDLRDKPPQPPADGLSTAIPSSSFLNLNRGSTSTASSISTRASLLAPHSFAPSGTHRASNSVDSPTVASESPPSSRQSPRQSQTNRPSSSAMPYNQDGERYQPRGHSRNRSAKGSNDSGKTRAVKPPSQKAMLSRALQKANTAVQLDNAQNFEGAREAYAEACELLQQVLQKTSGEEDKRKLEAIRRTYTSRINELDLLSPRQGPVSKALPARPVSPDHQDDPPSRNEKTYFEEDDFVPQQQPQVQPQQQSRQQDTYSRRDASKERSQDRSRALQYSEQGALQSSFSKPRHARNDSQQLLEDATYIPPSSAARRPSSPLLTHQDDAEAAGLQSYANAGHAQDAPGDAKGHVREESASSWLDPIDESARSGGSSVRSGTSSRSYHGRHIRAPSGNTEAEFDTALDAAIEAAYDEGYEPSESDYYSRRRPSEEEIVAQALRKVELARERVRQTERDAYGAANGAARQQQLRSQHHQYERHNTSEGFYDDDSSEEDERILEEMTRDLAIEDFTLQPPNKVLNARGPDPTQRAPKMGQASLTSGSMPPPKPLSTANDRALNSSLPRNLQPSAPPPTQSLPEIPKQRSATPPQTVRNRRLSGQHRKQLKIETTKLGPSTSAFGEVASKSRAAVAAAAEARRDAPSGDAEESVGTARWQSPPDAEPVASEQRQFRSPVDQRSVADEDDNTTGRSGSPSMNKLRKNFSATSLRSLKSRNLSISNLDETSDMSPGTPSSHNFASSRAPAMPALPTPLAAAFRDQVDVSTSGGMHLFDDTLHLPNTPGSPNLTSLDPPVPLESCPTDFMLRPFWLMRCLYQTLVHPRGGYLSTKLFVPRDVWRVKGVKLKNIEDKIGNCDYLTAALLKLAKVDTYDADAVLEEMQSLEGVLEQVQAALSRKLGSEVGVQSSGVLFKEASPSVDGEAAAGMPRSASVSGKSTSFSWRRLRSKNSGVGMSGAYNGRSTAPDAMRDVASVPTLPMTPTPTSRPPKRDLAQAVFSGPNAHYMNSLARLFDAAQAVDQIARQVDDPGLRHADKTQVGLELCTRHAAEFFGFFICRFVLSDLGMLLDKFIKRGSEWVLA